MSAIPRNFDAECFWVEDFAAVVVVAAGHTPLGILEALLEGSETVWRDTFEPEEEVVMAHYWLWLTYFHLTTERPLNVDTFEVADCEEATVAADGDGAFDGGLLEALTQSRTKLWL